MVVMVVVALMYCNCNAVAVTVVKFSCSDRIGAAGLAPRLNTMLSL